MKLAWLQNRLSVMGLHEVLFRIGRVISTRYELLKYRVIDDTASAPTLINSQIGLYSNCLDINFNIDQQASLSSNTSSDKPIQLFFQQPPILHDESIDWSKDPKTGIVAPCAFGKLIDYRNEKIVGDIKYLWELGRHQFLIPLAIDISDGKDQASKRKLEMYLQTWLDQNPVKQGIHWCSSLEVALRLIAWSFVHSILLAGGTKNGIFDYVTDSRKLQRSIYHQIKFIQAYYSRHSSANNHLIGELVGVWVACNIFRFEKHTIDWSKNAQSELELQANLQNHDDGVNREQAIYYHLWVLEYLTLAWLVGCRFNRPFSANFVSIIAHMTGFLRNVCSESSNPPNIGDADGGQVARFSHAVSENPYRDILQTFDACVGNGISEKSMYTKPYWYSRIKDSQSDEQDEIHGAALIAQEKELPIAYPSGGYCILGDKKQKICFKAGSMGYLGTASHGHADLLSVCLSIDNLWWLTDQGTYSYHSDADWRDYFRGTSAHNTVQIDSLNQSRIGGAFLWMEKASASMFDLVNGEIQSVKAQLNSYQSVKVGCSRELRYDTSNQSLSIYDEVSMEESSELKTIQIRYHFHPLVSIEKNSEVFYSAQMDGKTEKLEIRLSEELDWVVLKGQTAPSIEGWYSEGYDHKVPANVLIGTAQVSSSIQIHTSIALAQK